MEIGHHIIHVLEGLIGLAHVKWITRLVLIIKGRKLQSRYGRLSLAMNTLRFATRGGIKDLLRDYRNNQSEEGWKRVIRRADHNYEQLQVLRAATGVLEKDGTLGLDPDIANLEQNLGKSDFYKHLFRLRSAPPDVEEVDYLIGWATNIEARMAQVDKAQRRLVKRMEDVRKRINRYEDKLI